MKISPLYMYWSLEDYKLQKFETTTTQHSSQNKTNKTPHHFFIYFMQPDQNKHYMKTKEEIALRNSTQLNSQKTYVAHRICLLSLYSSNL